MPDVPTHKNCEGDIIVQLNENLRTDERSPVVHTSKSYIYFANTAGKPHQAQKLQVGCNTMSYHHSCLLCAEKNGHFYLLLHLLKVIEQIKLLLENSLVCHTETSHCFIVKLVQGAVLTTGWPLLTDIPS